MISQFVRLAIALAVCLAVTNVQAAPRGGGREGGREGGRNSAPGGEWSQRTHNSQGFNQAGHMNGAGRTGGAAGVNNSSRRNEGATGGEGAAAARNRENPAASGKQGAAAGAAVNNRRQPQATGKQGAAAGAAAANRNNPQFSGAQGAAAGAAAANRNNPQFSGAEGAAAGAAAANRNNPQFSGAQGAAAGAAVANRNNPQISGAAGAAVGADAVRNSFDNPNLYSAHWYGANAGVWHPTAWAAGAAWAPTTWGAVGGYYGGNATAMPYNYGNNVVYDNGNVMMNGENLGTAADYSQRAADIAATGAAADAANSNDWMPLGVFAMVRNEQQHPQLILQMAINKQGILRGNYTDEVTEHTQPIQGAVDPQTQRAAWTVGNNKSSIMEAGISNLSEGEAPALIHKNGKTDHWLLVRLNQPNQEGGAGPQ